MLRKIVVAVTLITFAMMTTMGASCQQGFQYNWDQFIQKVCANYEIYHPAIENGVTSLQNVLDLIISGWPEDDVSGAQIKSFIFAAQIVLAGLTQVLARVAKECPEKADVEATETVVNNVLKNSVVQLAVKQAKVNLAKKAAKKK